MQLDYSLLTIEKAIAHQIPKRTVDGSPVTFQLSQKESPLSPKVKAGLKTRITRSFTSRQLDVVFETETQSPVPQLISRYFTEEASDLVSLSCDLMMRLHAVDPQRSNGYLAIVTAKYNNQPCLLVTKLDSGTNINFKWEDMEDGTGYYQFEEMEGVPQYTKVFKAALFMQELSTDGYFGVISDNQTLGVANFFLKRFLGCQPREDAATTTGKMFHSLRDWINTNVEDNAQKGKYLGAIMVELASNDPQFHLEACLQKHMTAADSDRARVALRDQGLPLAAFEKDTAHIAPHLQRIEWSFEKVKLIAPADAEETGLIQLHQTEDGKVSVTFEDRLDSTKARR